MTSFAKVTNFTKYKKRYVFAQQTTNFLPSCKRCCGGSSCWPRMKEQTTKLTMNFQRSKAPSILKSSSLRKISKRCWRRCIIISETIRVKWSEQSVLGKVLLWFTRSQPTRNKDSCSWRCPTSSLIFKSITGTAQLCSVCYHRVCFAKFLLQYCLKDRWFLCMIIFQFWRQ